MTYAPPGVADIAWYAWTSNEACHNSDKTKDQSTILQALPHYPVKISQGYHLEKLSAQF